MAHICLANLLEEERGKELLLQLVCPAVIHLLSSEGNYDLKLDAISVRSLHDQSRKCQNNLAVDLYNFQLDTMSGQQCSTVKTVRNYYKLCTAMSGQRKFCPDIS